MSIARAGRQIEFGSRQEANDFRDQNPEALHPKDSRRRKAVRLAPDTDREAREAAERAATISRADETKSYGQVALTDAEKASLKAHDRFSWQENAFEARGAKAALRAEGVTDWLNYYEPGEGATGGLELLERGKEAEARTGAPTALSGDRDDTDADPGAAGRRLERAEGERERRAMDAAREGDAEALAALVDEFEWSRAEARELAAEDTNEIPEAAAPEPREPESAPEPDLEFPEPTPDAELEGVAPEIEAMSTPEVVARAVGGKVARGAREVAGGLRVMAAGVAVLAAEPRHDPAG